MGRVKENSIRRAVREGRAALGTGLKEFASRGVPRIIESSGFDYCMIDMEHGAFDMETIADLAAWFAATDVSAIARITQDGGFPAGNTPQQFAQEIRDETAKWAKVIKDAGLKTEK